MHMKVIVAVVLVVLVGLWLAVAEYVSAVEPDQDEIGLELEAMFGGNAPAPGSDLEARMKAVLAALNEHGEEWAAALSDEDRLDSWGTLFQVERLTERDAGLNGYEYIVHSAGEDRQFGTSDDISLHDEAPQGFQPSPLLDAQEPEEEDVLE